MGFDIIRSCGYVGIANWHSASKASVNYSKRLHCNVAYPVSSSFPYPFLWKIKGGEFMDTWDFVDWEAKYVGTG
jgi:hypothetical protein